MKGGIFIFVYPGNLKEKKTMLYMTVVDLIVTGILTISFVIYSAENLSLVPLVIPITYAILKIRVLENGINLWFQIVIMFNYLVNSQQTYFWGRRNEFLKNKSKKYK